MRTGLAWVSLVAVVATTGCMLAGRGRGGGSGLRQFYLTKETVQGNQMLGACAAGYHAASRFEVLDVSHLAYDSDRGFVTADAGSGPPSKSTYDSPDPSGWIRTGGPSSFTDGVRAPGSAFTNCAVWTSASHDAYGTVAYLTAQFAGASAPAAVWNGGSQPCDVPAHVWCVEDHVAASAPAETEGRRRRWERF